MCGIYDHVRCIQPCAVYTTMCGAGMSLVREQTDRSRNRSRKPNPRERKIVPVRERKKSKIVPVNRSVPVNRFVPVNRSRK